MSSKRAKKGEGKSNRLVSKVKSVEEKLGREVKKL